MDTEFSPPVVKVLGVTSDSFVIGKTFLKRWEITVDDKTLEDLCKGKDIILDIDIKFSDVAAQEEWREAGLTLENHCMIRDQFRNYIYLGVNFTDPITYKLLSYKLSFEPQLRCIEDLI